ncbi:hypothetical protein BURC_03515 [Burkholderiaceae bacterium]|nr:hypothetical protein BURC_03515 [Burkholderiaceae bacterium]
MTSEHHVARRITPLSLATLLLVLGAAGAAAQQAAPAAAAGCTVVAGGGRHLPVDDTLLKDRWNRLNFSFFDAASAAVGAERRVVQTFFPVESSDPKKNDALALAEAAKAGCATVLFVSVFDDEAQAEPELVFALKALAVQKKAGRKQAPQFAAGAALYEKEYRYPATPDSLARVVPARIAERAVDDYLRSVKR